MIVLLGIAGGLIAPRLVNTAQRKARAKVQELAELLSVAARRDSCAAAGAESQRITYDAETRRVELLVRRTRDDSRGRPGEPGVWRNDPLAPPVTLEGVRISQTLVDGVTADDHGWQLDIAPGRVRPAIEMLVETDDGNKDRFAARRGGPVQQWYLLVLPYAAAAEITEVGAGGPASRALRSVDLDASGMGDRAW